MKCWWNTRKNKIKHTGVTDAIICINCGKETIIDVDNMNTTYKYIITTIVLNKMLHHVGMLWIIENHVELKYDMDIKV